MTPSFTCYFKRRKSRLIVVCVRVPCALSVNHNNKKSNVSKGTHHAAACALQKNISKNQGKPQLQVSSNFQQHKQKCHPVLPYHINMAILQYTVDLLWNRLFTNEFATFKQMQAKKLFLMSDSALANQLLSRRPFFLWTIWHKRYMQLPSKKVQMFFPLPQRPFCSRCAPLPSPAATPTTAAPTTPGSRGGSSWPYPTPSAPSGWASHSGSPSSTRCRTPYTGSHYRSPVLKWRWERALKKKYIVEVNAGICVISCSWR